MENLPGEHPWLFESVSKIIPYDSLRVADKPADAKPRKGFGGARVVEIVSDHDGALDAVCGIRARDPALG